MTIDDVIKKSERLADKEVGRGATVPDIEAAESALGVVLPPSYRVFLTRWGWGRFGPDRIFGLGVDVPSHHDLIRITMSERTEANPNLPLYLTPLMNDGAGNHYCLDSRNPSSDYENAIVFWDHELGFEQHPEFVADSFTCWFDKLLSRLSQK